MRPPVVRGDPRLFEHVVGVAEHTHLDRLWLIIAFVWDTYGFANGRLNPTSRLLGPPPDGLHKLIVPTAEMIDEAMDEFLATVLSPDERQLLVAIPRRMNPGKSTTDLLTSADGGAALLMPLGAYGALFRWNEHLARLRQDHPGPPLPPDRDLTRSLACLFSGDLPDDLLSRGNIDRYLMELDSWRTTPTGRALRRVIWERTIFQQAVMILHEFGHVALINAQGEEPPTEQPALRSMVGLTNELRADAVSSRWVRAAADRLMGHRPDGRFWASMALWDLFLLQDVVDDHLGRPERKWASNIRFPYLVYDLGALPQLPLIEPIFEETVRVVGGRTREDFLRHRWRALGDYAELVQRRGRADPSWRREIPVRDHFGLIRTLLGLVT